MRRSSAFLGRLVAAAVVAAPLVLLGASARQTPGPIVYRLTVPEPQQRWMQLEATFTDLPPQPLEIRMSRTSPGRYALHDFAKNVFDVSATDRSGRSLAAAQPELHVWRIDRHDGFVRVSYKVFGDRLDGTYLAIDATHAHVNMPAALIWARGLGERPARVRFEPPPGRTWRVATQLYPTNDPLEFTAPNLQYLMDSPAEFGTFTERSFTLPSAGEPGATFRIALHHNGTEAEADRFTADVQRIVRQEISIVGELPSYETGRYTFLADYLPHAGSDGMEHRNSTSLTSPGALRDSQWRLGLLGTVAHEFFHGWNVERIRPDSLEPFDFEQANVSGELWLAEGFTTYYEALVLRRAGLAPLEATLETFADLINTIATSPGRRFRSAVEMSRLAPLVDGASSADSTISDGTYISYYTWGAAIALGLDLSLRDRTEGQVTLDDYMRAMWRVHGKPSGAAPGLVAKPYTLGDARSRLAETSHEASFANDFFARYIEGHEIVDYERLLRRAGFLLRQGDQQRLELMAIERADGTLTEAQRSFREAWLGPK